METRNLVASDGLKVWIRSWHFAKRRFEQLLLVATVCFTFIAVTLLVPWVGGAISGIALGLLSFGFFCIADEIRRIGKFNFLSLFKGIKKENLRKFFPLIV